MLSELFLYKKKTGLFPKVLEKSNTIQGRYHVSPDYGHDLNTNNLDTFLNDAFKGIQIPAQKYPLAVCMTPKSSFIKLNGEKWEQFIFDLYFLNTTETQSNQIRSFNKATNTSNQEPSDDWDEMKSSASDFIEACELVIKSNSIDNVPLKNYINLSYDKSQIRRLSRFGNDKLSGVQLSFIVIMHTNSCVLSDYDANMVKSISLFDTQNE